VENAYAPSSPSLPLAPTSPALPWAPSSPPLESPRQFSTASEDLERDPGTKLLQTKLEDAIRRGDEEAKMRIMQDIKKSVRDPTTKLPSNTENSSLNSREPDQFDSVNDFLDSQPFEVPGKFASMPGEIEPTEEGGDFDADEGVPEEEHSIADPYGEANQFDPDFKEEVVEYLKKRKGRRGQISRLSKMLNVGEDHLKALLENDKDFQIIGDNEVEHVDAAERQAYDEFVDYMTARDDLRFTSFRCDPEKEYDFVHRAARLALKVRPDDVLYVLRQVRKRTMKRPGRTPIGKYPANMPLVLACIVDRIMYLVRKQGQKRICPWALTLGRGAHPVLFDGWVLGLVEGSQFLANMIITWERLCYFKREYIRECQEPFWLLIRYAKKEGVPDADKNESKGWYKIVARPSDALEGCEAIAPPGIAITPAPPRETEPEKSASEEASSRAMASPSSPPLGSALVGSPPLGSPAIGSPAVGSPGLPQPPSTRSQGSNVTQEPTPGSPTIDVDVDLAAMKKEDLQAIIASTTTSKTPISPTETAVPLSPQLSAAASTPAAQGTPAALTPGTPAGGTPSQAQIAQLTLVMQAVGSSAPITPGAPALATDMPLPQSPTLSETSKGLSDSQPSSPAIAPTEQPVPRSPEPASIMPGSPTVTVEPVPGVSKTPEEFPMSPPTAASHLPMSPPLSQLPMSPPTMVPGKSGVEVPGSPGSPQVPTEVPTETFSPTKSPTMNIGGLVSPTLTDTETYPDSGYSPGATSAISPFQHSPAVLKADREIDKLMEKKRALEEAASSQHHKGEKGVVLPVISNSQDEASQPPQKMQRTG